jgi:hypothetical protein
MVTVPLRVLPGFDAIVNATVPLPVPLAPDLIVMNGELLTAVHAHVAALVPTLTLMVSPPPFALALVEPIENAHVAAGVVVVVVGDGVVELLEHAAANDAATNPILVTAAANVRWCLDIGRIS